MSYQEESKDWVEIEPEGAWLPDSISTIEQDGERVTCIHGFPLCPICFAALLLRNMPDLGETHWYCRSCGTQWETPDLIKAMNMEE